METQANHDGPPAALEPASLPEPNLLGEVRALMAQQQAMLQRFEAATEAVRHRVSKGTDPRQSSDL